MVEEPRTHAEQDQGGVDGRGWAPLLIMGVSAERDPDDGPGRTDKTVENLGIQSIMTSHVLYELDELCVLLIISFYVIF